MRRWTRFAAVVGGVIVTLITGKVEEMRIIAIDPGPTHSAIIELEGKIYMHGKYPNEEILTMIAGVPEPEVMVIEMVESFGMPVGKEVFETVWWTGRFCQVWGGTFFRIGRKDIKLHLCGSVRAKDANIRAALIDKLGKPGTKKSPGPTYGIKSDVWSALAVGVTFRELHGGKPWKDQPTT